MTTKTALLAAVSILAFSAFTVIAPADWQPKEESYAIKFDTKGASGIIKGLKGTIHFDNADPSASHFDVSVDVNTLNTGNGLKNHHAKGDGFFDAAKYPQIRFTSSKVEKTATGFLVAGKLTIKDVTREETIPFSFDNSGEEGTFKGNFEVKREDFNLKRGGVGEVVSIELAIPVKKI